MMISSARSKTVSSYCKLDNIQLVHAHCTVSYLRRQFLGFWRLRSVASSAVIWFLGVSDFTVFHSSVIVRRLSSGSLDRLRRTTQRLTALAVPVHVRTGRGQLVDPGQTAVAVADRRQKHAEAFERQLIGEHVLPQSAEFRLVVRERYAFQVASGCE